MEKFYITDYQINENTAVVIDEDGNEHTYDIERFKDLFVVCENCGELIWSDEAISNLYGSLYCADCCSTCSYCGSLIAPGDEAEFENSSNIYCRDCREDIGYCCSDCGRYYRWQDDGDYVGDTWYCYRCIEDHQVIRGYHDFKDNEEPLFMGDETTYGWMDSDESIKERKEKPFIGFELEVDSSSSVDRDGLAMKLYDIFGDYFHYENDCSLNNGWENISQPCSLKRHMSLMPKIREAFDMLKENGMRSHNTSTCGMHMHIDREYFGDSEETAIARLLYIFEKFKKELTIFSRRNEVDQWCAFRRHESSTGPWLKDAAKNLHYGRYYAVNLCNSNTIEIRLWRGTLNADTFAATLKFTARLAEICKKVRAVDLARLTFEDLIGDDEEIKAYWEKAKERHERRSHN